MSARYWLNKIRELPLTSSLHIMNVCGGHERTVTKAGFRTILPETIKLIPGPGCPVCVCPEETIQFAIKLSEQNNLMVACFGDMLRVPANSGKNAINSLSESRSLGHHVVPVASPQEVINLAKKHSNKTIIFFIAGFETTLAPIAAMLDQGIPDNLKLLLAAHKTWPVVDKLLRQKSNNLDALIAPGHVASIMGSNEWEFVCNDYNTPCAIAGFDESSLLAAIYSVCRQALEAQSFVDNCYASVAKTNGNPIAKLLFEKYFEITNANWRGIGKIEKSGFALKPEFSHWNAETIYQDLWQETLDKTNKNKRDMPPGCDCDQVVLGKILPYECRLFNKACTPTQPIGPCMVSDEGACHIWWSSGGFRPLNIGHQ